MWECKSLIASILSGPPTDLPGYLPSRWTMSPIGLFVMNENSQNFNMPLNISIRFYSSVTYYRERKKEITWQSRIVVVIGIAAPKVDYLSS